MCLTLPFSEKRASVFYYGLLWMWNLLQISLLTMAEPYIYQSLHESSPPEEPPHYSHRPLKKWLKCQCWKFQWFVYCLGPLLLKREAATKTSQGDEPQWKEVTISSGTCFLSAWIKKKKNQGYRMTKSIRLQGGCKGKHILRPGFKWHSRRNGSSRLLWLLARFCPSLKISHFLLFLPPE